MAMSPRLFRLAPFLVLTFGACKAGSPPPASAGHPTAEGATASTTKGGIDLAAIDRSIAPGENADRYPVGDEPAENTFELDELIAPRATASPTQQQRTLRPKLP